MGLMHGIKKSFWRGLAILLPALLTLVVLKFGLSLLDEYAGQYVNKAIMGITVLVTGVSADEVRTWYYGHWLGWVGTVAAVIGLCVVAYFVGTFIGIWVFRLLEHGVMHVPLVKKIYPSAKQVSEFFFAERKVDFRRVVAVEFPRPGMWMIGFVTGQGLKSLSDKGGRELMSVFVPFTPAPVTGYVVMVVKEEVVDLPMSVDEAIQFLISAGVIVPPAQRAGPAGPVPPDAEPLTAAQTSTARP
jgi:uncharacterized membrane protein